MEADAIVGMLEPLREPGAVHWWPLAPGWWFLGLMLLMLLSYGLRKLWLFHRRAAPLRAARRALLAIEAAELSDAERVAEIGFLQRRLAMGIAGRKACAGLTGQAWVDFLNTLTKDKASYFDSELADIAYRPQVNSQDCQYALKATQRWLNDLARPK